MKKEILKKKLVIRLSETDFDKLKSISNQCNMTLSRYVRTACFKKEIKPNFSDEERQFMSRLYNLANNMNQAAKALHMQSKEPNLIVRLENTLDHIDHYIHKVLNHDSKNN